MTKQQSLIYGAIVAVAVFFVGWSTGMGGSFLPNLIFSLLVGVLAIVAVRIVTKFAKRDHDE